MKSFSLIIYGIYLEFSIEECLNEQNIKVGVIVDVIMINVRVMKIENVLYFIGQIYNYIFRI